MSYIKLISLCCCLCLLACSEQKKEIADTTTSKANPTQATAQTDDFNPSKNAYFGDLHIHTSWSFDAFIYNTRTNPDDAYRFAKGEKIKHSAIDGIQLQRPLDFMAVTDHAEYMGVIKKMIDPSHPFFNLAVAKEVRDPDPQISLSAFTEIGVSISRNQPFKELNQEDIRRTTWQEIVKVANKHYEPGKFTTFPAYEWTSSPGDTIKYLDGKQATFARNLHRNVFFKSDNVPELPFSSFNSQNPEDLWDWMDIQRSKGIELLAVPHNGNMSCLLYTSPSRRDRG